MASDPTRPAMPARRGGSGPAKRPEPVRDEQPLYLSLYQALRGELHGDRWTVGASLPSEAELSERFGVSRITVRHALRLLESDGYIRKAPARRPVVVATEPTRRAGWVMESLDDVVAMVGNARLAVQSWGEETAPDEADLFGLPPRTPLPCLRSLLVRDGRPYARSVIYFPPAVGAKLKRESFDDAVVFRVLQRDLGVRFDDVRLTVGAEAAGADDVSALGCEPGGPLLVMQLLYREGGRLVEIAHSRSLASAARLSTRLTTGPRRP